MAVTIRFNRPHRAYQTGDEATFTPSVAGQLVSSGTAVYVSKDAPPPPIPPAAPPVGRTKAKTAAEVPPVPPVAPPAGEPTPEEETNGSADTGAGAEGA